MLGAVDRPAATWCVAVLVVATVAACSGRSTTCESGKCGPTRTTTSTTEAHVVAEGTGAVRRGGAMGDAISALRPWCHEVERVYRTEAVPPKRGLVEDTVRLVDRLQSIDDTGSGVASMKDSARESPRHASLVLAVLRDGSPCRSGSDSLGSSTTPVVVSPR